MSKQDRVILQAIVAELQAIHEILAKEDKAKTEGCGVHGRPSMGHVVRLYRMQHPNENQMEVTRATGLCRKTVRKYWDIKAYAGEEASAKEA